MKIKRNVLIGACIAGLGGALGATIRALLLLPGFSALGAIFLINVLGSLLFGFFMRMLQRRYTLNHHFTEFLLTGFCGGLTTFSSVIAFFSNIDIVEFVVYTFLMSVLSMIALAWGAWIATKTIKIG